MRKTGNPTGAWQKTPGGERGTRKMRGLILVFTGDGKGKTTAAFGTALRMTGRGGRVGVVEFFKSGTRDSGLVSLDKAFRRGTRFKSWSFGGGFTWDTSRDVNQKAADKAWKKCQALLRDRKYALLIFDEIHIAFRHKFLKVSEVVKALKRRRPGQHVILTGRNAPQAVIRHADLVTEMKCVKHPFERGILAQPGIDF